MDSSCTHKFKQIFLTTIVFIMIMLGIILLITGNKAEDDSFGCLLIIAGFMLYYLVSCLVLNPNVYQSIDLDDVDEFDL
jgi:hypothetical protein